MSTIRRMWCLRLWKGHVSMQSIWKLRWMRMNNYAGRTARISGRLCCRLWESAITQEGLHCTGIDYGINFITLPDAQIDIECLQPFPPWFALPFPNDWSLLQLPMSRLLKMFNAPLGLCLLVHLADVLRVRFPLFLLRFLWRRKSVKTSFILRVRYI